MFSPDILTICIVAFTGVFIVLLVLAIVMHLMIRIFPEKETTDNAMFAAIYTSYNLNYPGHKITKIEEVK